MPAKDPGRFFRSKTDFRKQLAWHLKQPEHVELMDITPSMARVMMEFNDGNRRFNENRFKRYTRAMREGRWMLTGQSIILNAGRLLNGQHQLSAIIASNTTQRFVVAFGIESDAFSKMDRGGIRTPGEILSIAGVKDGTLIATALKWVIQYDMGELIASAGGNTVSSKLDADELLAAYNKKYSGLQESTWVGNLARKYRLLSKGPATALHYICAREDREQADEFFRHLLEGDGLTKSSSIFKLRKKLEANLASQEKAPAFIMAVAVIKAWNLMRNNRVGRKSSLEYIAGEPFPRAE